ncbi:ABC transporter substrate-binding protein [Acidovorax carolinensis]|uniref:ABC transporter substrate-binding protein n=1 Tax=Acidovorax carolinensis TaxID=553814 RepID=A0A240UGL4_9BURK|nr:tripartite tricarboxylate transporter substrate binding protein [Acidovorax carolinensis]ART56986.1 ABC transporter substrate-binding protein [Acidovorax carolinensis]ART60641.1 ABC transporter substrate-binding protein [Acidovorax carolinensis]
MQVQHRRRALRLAGAGALLGLAALATAPSALADTAWPTRPITFVVPGAAGGTTDTPARFMAQKLGERLGQSIVVDNKPGAGGMLGTGLVARAQPDGYTVLVGNTGSNAINYTAYQKLTYKPEDFIALTDMISFANVLVVPVKSPIKSLKDLVAAAKREPGKLAFSSAGVGQTTHLMGELLRQSAGVDVVHVPYKGSAPATMAIVGGETQFMFDNLTGSLGHIKDGKLRALAVTGATREPELPDVPTMTELGMKDFDKVGWMGFFVPSKTPPDIVKKLTDNLIAVLKDPAVVKRYQELGGRAGGMAPEQFSKIVERDRQDWGDLIRSQKLQLD